MVLPKLPGVAAGDVDGVRLSYGSRQAFCASARISGGGRGADHRDRRAVRRPPGRRDVARAQRVRLPQLALLLRRLGRRLPALAGAAVRHARRAERGLGHGVLVPALLRLGGDPAAATSGTFINPTQQLDFARFSSDELLDCFRAEAGIIRERSAHPVTTNFMGFSIFDRPVDYWTLGARRWTSSQRPLPDRRTSAGQLPGTGDDGRLDPGLGAGGPVAAHGALDVGGELAAPQHRQGAGRDAAQLAAARRPGRRRRAVLPVAGLARRRGEVPLGDAAARRHRTRRCGARWSSSARR